jgi:hypothetical protein
MARLQSEGFEASVEKLGVGLFTKQGLRVRNCGTLVLAESWKILKGSDSDIDRIIGVLDFVHHAEFVVIENTTFGNWICFRPQVRGGRHLLCWVPWFSHRG